MIVQVLILISDLRRPGIAALDDLDDEQPRWLNPPPGLVAPAGLAPVNGGLGVAARGATARPSRAATAGSHGRTLPSAGGDQLRQPAGVAVDAAGRLYAADSGNKRVVSMEADGSDSAAFGQLAATPADVGAFVAPLSVAISGSDEIVVADPGLARLVRFEDMNGTGWAPAPAADGALPVALSARDGQLAVAELSTPRVRLLEPSAAATATGSIGSPASLAFSDDGTLIVCDAVAGRLIRLEQYGDELRVTAEARIERIGIRRPVGVCVV